MFDNEGAKFCGNTWVDSIADQTYMFGDNKTMKIETEYCFCGKGKALSTAKTCDNCLSGKYQSQIEFKGECTSCIPGLFAIAVSSVTADDCKECEVGKSQATAGQPFCETCQPGKIQNQTGQSKCLDCGAGRYRQSTKDDEWTFAISPQDITASAGVTVTQTVSDVLVTGTLKIALTGADTTSIVVTATTESDSFISSENIVIATGTARTIAHADITSVGLTPTDPTICESCPAGWSSEEGSSRCLACDAGKVQITKMNLPICEDCPINTYTDEKAQISTCKDCDDAANSINGSSVCVKCDVGQYMTAGNPRSCVKCPAGQFSNYGKVECTECVQGYYANKTIAATECISCPTGQYGKDAAVELRVDKDGACDECGVGKYSLAEGAKLETSCIDCQPGKKAKDDQVARTEETEACTDCDAGHYRQSKKDDEWTFTISPQDVTASAGVAVTQTVSSDVVTGTLKTALIGADTKTIVVTDTKGGSFVSVTDIVIGTDGVALTIAHADITSVAKVTPTDPKTCVACPAGWSSVLGSTKCQACEAGMYSTIVGSCKDCNSGQYRNSETDPRSCVVCSAGQSSVLGSSKCQKCEAGKHGKPEKPDGRCYDCPTGFSRKNNSLSSLTKCEQCIKGETTKNNGSATCEKW